GPRARRPRRSRLWPGKAPPRGGFSPESVPGRPRAARPDPRRRARPGARTRRIRFLAAGSLARARGRPSLLPQGGTEGSHAAGRVTFDGAAADAHGGGDVGFGQVGVVAEHDRFAL